MASLSGYQLTLKTPTDAAIAIQTAAPTNAQFSTIGGMQSVSTDWSATEIDVTNQSNSENRTILDGHGIKSFNVTGSGQLQDSTIAKALEVNVFSNNLRWFQIEQDDNPSGSQRRYTAKFKISSYSFSGNHDGSVDFSMTLMSSGAVTIS